ncbi:S8 family serine peptidase [Pseudonocardia saturnea]
MEIATGSLVDADPARIADLERQGFRVKVLRDTNLLRIGDHEIDIDAPADTTDGVPPGSRATWPHHLVQLVAPPTEEWVRAIEERDVDVVEPVSAYGLFVSGPPERVAALLDLPFVAWTGPLLPRYRIAPSARGLTGAVTLSVTVFPAHEADGVARRVVGLGGSVERRKEVPSTYGDLFAVLTVGIAATRIPMLAAEPFVRWIEHRPPYGPDGEREAQIIAENFDAVPPPATAPVSGYPAWLASVGLDGAGVTVAVADTGVDANATNNAAGHTDLRGRQRAFVDYSAGAVVTDTDGHGTHVAGIAVGSAATGQRENGAPNSFLWGQGVAPQAGYVTQAFLLADPQPATAQLIADAATNAAHVMNNSWSTRNSPGQGYTSGAQVVDRCVRDPAPTAAGLENLVIVCAAGNEGGSDRTISSPHESKNDIVVGNSLTARPNTGFPGDDVRGISASSSRGPAVDGRILPTVVAPGTDVSAALSRTSGRTPIAGTGTPDPTGGQPVDGYTFLSGTSMAAPGVSGVCALITQWWRQTRGGADPSPALVKALLINGAEDLAGGQNWRGLNRTTADKALWAAHPGAPSVFRRTLAHVPAAVAEGNVLLARVGSVAAITAAGGWFFDPATNRLFVRTTTGVSPGAAAFTVSSRDTQGLPPIPNGHQGWGRVSLENILLQAPTSDRGPRIVSDQRHAFTAAGQEHLVRVAPVDTGRPLRITLVWTDATGAAGSDPALVNDLDLEVVELATGTVFKGNVFAGGFSVTNGGFDDRNNVECVYLAHPAGVYEVRVVAAGLAASARPDLLTPWQDFALVIDNAEVPPTAPVSVVGVLDRSSSMVAYDYVDATRAATRQFAGLLGIDDRLGLVSFGDAATVEFPAEGGPATITGQAVRDAASAAVDGIGFGGCTFMGDGITTARGLIAGGVGNRGVVLLSDGYDNKGCDAGNPAKPSAAAAAAALPAGVALHTCAMGPASDQALLAGLATGGGRYYYMPVIDDLHEIYNYVRGQVSGDAVSVIASAQASSSSVGVMVDALTTTATITVAWDDAEVVAVTGEPRKPNEVSIRLRDPRGTLLHPDASQVHRIVGGGFVVFRLHEPAAGGWLVEVATIRADRHLRYTVGGFCTSPLRLAVAVVPPRSVPGAPLTIGAVTLLDGRPIGAVRTTASVVAPAASLDAVLAANRDALAALDPPADLGTDRLPAEVARMATLRRTLAAAGKPDPFATVTTAVRMRAASANRLAATGLGGLLPQPPPAGGPTGVLAGRFDATAEAGSYNVVVRASGVEPGGSRFTRQELVSIVVG